MSQQLQNIPISAPAFKGLNTQDSPLTSDPSFAAVADNCVIDSYGRLGARKGFTTITSDNTLLNGSYTKVIHKFEDESGNTKIFSAVDNKILSGTGTLADESPASYSITADDWKIVNFSNHCYFFQRGHEPLVYSQADGAIIKMSSDANVVGTPIQANTALAAYGRLWVADTSSNKSTVWWSDLLNGAAWAGGTSGSIDLTKVWPDGYDEVVTLAAHNNFLIIFGRHSTVVYSGAQDPSTMELADTISGIGCIARDSVQYTGEDVIFLSHLGLQAFGRLIQQKSLPSRNLSYNIGKDLVTLVNQEETKITSVYSPKNNFYLLHLVGQGITYCFDTRGYLENGSARVTRWIDTQFKCFYDDEENGLLYTGGTSGIGSYSNYSDDGETYYFRFYSNPLTFGDPSRLKFLKKITPTILGSGGNLYIKWAYDFSDNYSSAVITLDTSEGSEYNVAEYNIGEYSGTAFGITRRGINTSGSGTVVTVGVEVYVSGQTFSIQELNVQALLGRIL